MKEYIEAKATRNYDITPIKARGITRCDMCKIWPKIQVYELIPNERLHNFDTLFLCDSCITKCGLEIKPNILNELKNEADKEIDEQRRDRNSSKTMEYDTDQISGI